MTQCSNALSYHYKLDTFVNTLIPSEFSPVREIVRVKTFEHFGLLIGQLKTSYWSNNHQR